MTEATISSVEPKLVLPLFGAKDQHLRRLREKFNVTITHRNGQVKISGENEDQVAQATDAIEQLTEIVRTKGNLTPAIFDETIA
ncbi:KH domain-containing protein, partial [bacterium]|nr:KH domain-containing protein [bacterium]